ncbi:hypothetical protein [Brevibacillus nitrificans]|uniref:hypothetical protein n=1 Tax=Brevibacillus nitrificans TaxID=651560 RepID=UPI0026212D90|nr:hypothetical protein [Brevibacillus nitrificans]
MTLDQAIGFAQEWGALVALFLFVGLLMASDFFPRVYEFIAHIESKYPRFETFIFTKELELIDRYEFLPPRIRNGFALIGGKATWAWLVTRLYRSMRERSIRKSGDENKQV